MVLSFSCKKDENKSSEKQIVEFTIGAFGPNSNGKIDEATKTISFEVPSGTDVTKLVPIIKISPYASISPAVGVAQDFTNPVTYTVIAEDGSKQVYTVKVVVLKSNENSILSFTFAGLNPKVEGKVDEVSKTVSLLVPYGTDVKELVPTVAISKNATVSPASDVKQDFSKPVTYTVTAEDGSKKDYAVTVSVGKSSENSIANFKFAGLNPVVEGTIDEAGKKIMLTVPCGTNVKELVPSFVISNGATASPASDVKQDFSNPVNYTVTAEDGKTKVYEVTVVLQQCFESKITGFKFDDLALTGDVDEATHEIKFKVPFGTNIKELAPSIALSDGATVVPASGEKQDFSNPVTYTVTSKDGKTQTYTVSIELVKSTECLIKEFKFAGLSPAVVATIDQDSKVIKAKVPFGTDITTLVPSILVSDNATVSPVSGGAVDFSQPVSFTVTAQNGDVRVYQVSVEVGKDPSILEIYSVSPNTFMAGVGEVVIKGQALKKDGYKTYVYFGGVKTIGFESEDGSQVSALVPNKAPLGNVKIWVQIGADLKSNELEVTIQENTMPSPEITEVSSTKLQNGDILEIKGKNFAKFGNSVRLISTNSGLKTTYILSVISEDETSIKVSTDRVVKALEYDLVVTSNGKEGKYSTPLTFTTKPAVIESVSPLKLKAGETITVTGKYLNKESCALIMIDGGGQQPKFPDSEHATIKVSTELKPGKHLLEIVIFSKAGKGAGSTVIYSTEIEIVE